MILTIFLILAMSGTSYAANNTTQIISISNNGLQGNQGSFDAVMSADGRFIAFSSDANNLVTGDTNGFRDVFVKDRFLNITERVSISTSGQEGDHNSQEPDISADGRYVIFTSFASNLIGGGVNSGQPQLYVRDRLLGTTELLSISPDGNPGDGWTQSGSINADGRFVVFISSSTNLMASATEGQYEVFVRDLVLNVSERVSISNDGSISGGCGWPPSISGNGRFVAFVSWAPLDGVDDLWADLFVYDCQLKTISKIAHQFHWDEGMSQIYQTSLSADGRYLAFVNRPFIIYGAPDFDDPNYWHYYNENIFLLDRVSGNIKKVSVSSSGVWGNYGSSEPYISADGRYLVFKSFASNLVVGDDNNAPDIFLCDLQSGTIQRVVESPLDYVGDSQFNPSLSPLGNYLLFNTDADDIVSGDSNWSTDVFLHIFKEKISIQGYLNHEQVKSGDVLRINAASNMDTITVTALINGVTHNLVKQPDNWWVLDYNVPLLLDGVYTITLTALDGAGNSGTNTINFTVDNTPPTILGSVNPNILRSGDALTLIVSSDQDTSSITVLIQIGTYNLNKHADGTWRLTYTVPDIVDGNYPIRLTATDFVGNRVSSILSVTVDNTPPAPTGTVTPSLVKSGDKIVVMVLSSADTARVSANINGTTTNMIKQFDGSWRSDYTVPSLSNGPQSVVITAIDNVGNQGIANLAFTIDNTPPTLTGTLTPEQVGAGGKIKINAQASSDTSNVFADINGQRIPLVYSNSSWTTSYNIPSNKAIGWDTVTLEATDNAGNQGWAYAYYLVTASGNSTTPGSPGGTTTSSGGNGNGLWSIGTGISNLSGTFSSGGTSSFISLNGLEDFLRGLMGNVNFDVKTSPSDISVFNPQGKTPSDIINHYFGNFVPLVLKDNPLLMDLMGWALFSNPLLGPINYLNPASPFNYVGSKFLEAAGKAWETGNVWDFFNYNFYHFDGYSNLDHVWGGENIKALLYWGFGIDENGNMSIAQFLLNIAAIIPIGRAASIAGKALSGILSKAGLKVGLNLADNVLLKGVTDLVGNLAKKFQLKNLETWKNAISWIISNALIPNPVGWATDILKVLAKSTGNEKLIAAVTAFSTFEFRRGLGELGNLLISSSSIDKVLNLYGEVGGFLNRNLNYLVDVSKNFVKGTVNTVKAGVSNVVNKITTPVKQTVSKAVNSVKKVVNKVVNNVKSTVKKVVKKTKTVVKKIVKTVKKTVKKVVSTVKKTVKKVATKVVRTVKKVVKTFKKTVSSAVNWVKSKIRWPW